MFGVNMCVCMYMCVLTSIFMQADVHEYVSIYIHMHVGRHA